LTKKKTKTEKGGPSSPFKLEMALAQSCKNISACLFRIQIPQLLKGGIDQLGVNCDSSFLLFESHQKQQIFELHKIGEVNMFVFSQ
jgi:hypothetical protein